MNWKEKMFRDSRCIVMHEYWSMTIDHEIEHRCRERIANWQGGVRFDSPNRWIGFAGEEAFNALLYRYEIFGDWVSKKPNTRGPLDFIVAPRRIDVKTRQSRIYPSSDYMVNYNEAQLQENKKVNHLVFAVYVPDPRRALHIVGHLSKKDFIEKARYTKQGDKLHNRNPGVDVVTSDMRDLPIRELGSIWDLIKDMKGVKA